MTNEPPDWLVHYLLSRYRDSSYANFLQMEILEVHDGEIAVSMLVRHELTNLSKSIHGGAVGSLLEMAMNLACFSTGRRALILGFNTNFLRGTREGQTVRAVAKTLHRGKSTLVVEGRVLDDRDRLLAKARGTFVATGQFSPEDPLNHPPPLPERQEPPVDGGGPPPVPAAEAACRPAWLRELLLQVHGRNHFARYLGMEIAALGQGNGIVAMPVTGRHINFRGVVHGGALASLADMSMMLACATLARHTVTLDLNISFLRRVSQGDVIWAYPQVIHSGKRTLVVRTGILDRGARLLAEARGTFFVTGDYTPGEGDLTAL